MTATDELRRLLDERGVEWHGCNCIFWDDSDAVRSIWKDDALDVTLYGVTPEQAVAATLGPGTCHDEGDPSDFCCSECGVRMFTNTSDTYTMIAADERTIIKHPNYCPNCGAKVVK